LTLLTVTGWCAMAGHRTSSAAASGKPYGLENLKAGFHHTEFQPYDFALALLSIMRVFLGYENANFVWPLPAQRLIPFLITSPSRSLKKFADRRMTLLVFTEDRPKLQCLELLSFI
jgi:hypothetical protein